MPDSHWCTPTPMAMQVFCRCVAIPLQRGALTLLVSTYWALSYEPQDVKRATVQGFTLEPKYNT
ncbi:MAG: hypothetical protein PUF62_11495 [Bacteroidales bacterium]|nr:hypothetical protein [Bacteroidales bacterium]